MALETCETLDPRIRRTRQLLQQALEKLLETKEFEKISVQDVTEVATVNRATFYDHYADKFALLEAMVGCRFHALLAEREVQFDGTCGSALKAMVLAVCEYLTRMQGPGGGRQLEPHMESAIIAVVRRILMAVSYTHLSLAGHRGVDELALVAYLAVGQIPNLYVLGIAGVANVDLLIVGREADAVGLV